MVFEQAGNNFIDKITTRQLFFILNQLIQMSFFRVFTKRKKNILEIMMYRYIVMLTEIIFEFLIDFTFFFSILLIANAIVTFKFL